MKFSGPLDKNLNQSVKLKIKKYLGSSDTFFDMSVFLDNLKYLRRN